MNLMNFFKKKPSTNGIEGIEHEISSLQIEETKLVAEIKKSAKTGNEAVTRILARQLIRLRQQITNLQGSHTQLSSAPKGRIASKKSENNIASPSSASNDVEDLDKMLASLRRR